jgi:hypothetical protein
MYTEAVSVYWWHLEHSTPFICMNLILIRISGSVVGSQRFSVVLVMWHDTLLSVTPSHGAIVPLSFILHIAF